MTPHVECWIRYCPDHACLLRHACRVASAWTRWRNRDFSRWPWELAATGDARPSEDEVPSALQCFYHSNLCCIDICLSQRVRARKDPIYVQLLCCQRIFYRWLAHGLSLFTTSSRGAPATAAMRVIEQIGQIARPPGYWTKLRPEHVLC